MGTEIDYIKVVCKIDIITESFQFIINRIYDAEETTMMYDKEEYALLNMEYLMYALLNMEDLVNDSKIVRNFRNGIPPNIGDIIQVAMVSITNDDLYIVDNYLKECHGYISSGIDYSLNIKYLCREATKGEKRRNQLDKLGI